MQLQRLSQPFYESFDTVTLSRELLGCILLHDHPAGITSGMIVETEAYLADDPACHAFNRRTARTEPMYADAGTIYIYTIYGMYQCINVVSNRKDIGEAVLIRALEPIDGLDLMRQRRADSRKSASTKIISDRDLCRGPGRLVTAMGIELQKFNHQKFTEGTLGIYDRLSTGFEITSSARIGISTGKDLPYRFTIRGSSFVSK
ncbi:MAG TPA: DNA-3-methyladenine glycosylase [Dyadobacter sp.]|jgi:DNA-3-methyladenine glycosylase|nr:DNA-3-methyladenine glycosylase [Dyadobacter sp.]